jgi:hypothetical protein
MRTRLREPHLLYPLALLAGLFKASIIGGKQLWVGHVAVFHRDRMKVPRSMPPVRLAIAGVHPSVGYRL